MSNESTTAHSQRVLQLVEESIPLDEFLSLAKDASGEASSKSTVFRDGRVVPLLVELGPRALRVSVGAHFAGAPRMSRPERAIREPKGPLSVKQVARLLGIHELDVQRLAESGRLKATKTSDGWVVDARDLNAFVIARGRKR